MLMPVIDNAVPETSVRVIVCAALVVPTVCAAKVRLLGESDTAVPTPLIATVCVPALSLMVRLAVRALMFVGENFTLMLQLALADRDDPQLLV